MHQRRLDLRLYDERRTGGGVPLPQPHPADQAGRQLGRDGIADLPPGLDHAFRRQAAERAALGSRKAPSGCPSASRTRRICWPISRGDAGRRRRGGRHNSSSCQAWPWHPEFGVSRARPALVGERVRLAGKLVDGEAEPCHANEWGPQGSSMPQIATAKTDASSQPFTLDVLKDIERKVLWLSTQMIHHANHMRANDDGLKVGGHQASSASVVTIMTALYFAILRPQDRVAVKPHATPCSMRSNICSAIRHAKSSKNFRGYKGAQSYPSRTKDADDVDFSTGSVGLGVAHTSFASLTQDYLRAKGWVPMRPRVRWSLCLATPRSTRATFSRRCSKAGSTTSATPGGSSTTTDRALTLSCARGCGSASNHLPQFRLGCHRPQVWLPAEAGLRRTGRRGA